MVDRPITVVQMLPELESGGVERGTLELGKYLSNRGHRSMVISGGGRMVLQLEKEKSRHISWPVGAKHPGCLKYILPLRKLLKEEKVDILHLRSRLPAWIGYLAWKSLPEKDRPILVTTFHGFYSVNAYSAVMTKGERVIAISKTVASHIQKSYGVDASKIVIIYRGFDETAFDPKTVDVQRVVRLKDAWGIKDMDFPLIMLPGRLTRLKGHDIFLKSLSRIAHLQWFAVCVGDKDENPGHTARLQTMITEMNLGKRVRLVGHCEDMPAAFMMSDVVVSATASKPEAFGRIAIEAQAMAKPMIASAHGGSLETILDQQTGWLVNPRDPESLAKALKEALSDKALREKRGVAGRKWVIDKFTTRKMCSQTVALYDALLQKHTTA